jgi:hypothetical protein
MLNCLFPEYATASAGLHLPVNMWSMWWYRPSSKGRKLDNEVYDGVLGTVCSILFLLIQEKCGKCSGKGTTKVKKSVSVNVPSGKESEVPSESCNLLSKD